MHLWQRNEGEALVHRGGRQKLIRMGIPNTFLEAGIRKGEGENTGERGIRHSVSFHLSLLKEPLREIVLSLLSRSRVGQGECSESQKFRPLPGVAHLPSGRARAWTQLSRQCGNTCRGTVSQTGWTLSILREKEITQHQYIFKYVFFIKTPLRTTPKSIVRLTICNVDSRLFLSRLFCCPPWVQLLQHHCIVHMPPCTSEWGI